jgi:transposase InsO family protein
MSNEIYKKNDLIYRCLEINEDKLLVVDCVKRTLPCWVSNDFLIGFEVISEEQMLKELNIVLPTIGDLSQTQLKVMHLRYGSISSCLVKVINEIERRLMIYKASLDYEVSTQTIRHRLCDYLVFQNIVILAPKIKKIKELTDDEKNFRWALNKYFYNFKKLSLRQTYKFLVRDKYLDSNGKIKQNCPKFHQFKYFYYKNRNKSNFIISRYGKGEYDKNFRPLLGQGVRDFCPTIGYGMLDSTTCDIYLINECGQLIGRPIFSACIDGYSGMCLGYSIGWEGGINSLRRLMNNIVTDKVDWCKKFGVEISENDWNCHWIPHKLITDMGSEYVGDTFSQLVDLGIEFINLKPYRPELKSLVERFFGLVQDSFKKELLNKGVVLKDFGDRGVVDYRKKACLTLEQFEKIIILCIVHYNCGRLIDLPYGITNVKSHCKDLWNYCLLNNKDRLIEVDKDLLELTLLPRTNGKFKRDGLWVNKLRYKSYGFTNEYLDGGEVVVAYDPYNVSYVWLVKDNQYYKFELIEKFFNEMSLIDVDEYKNNLLDKTAFNEELESEIRLSNDIENVVKHIKVGNVKTKNIKKNRNKEIRNNR